MRFVRSCDSCARGALFLLSFSAANISAFFSTLFITVANISAISLFERKLNSFITSAIFVGSATGILVVFFSVLLVIAAVAVGVYVSYRKKISYYTILDDVGSAVISRSTKRNMLLGNVMSLEEEEFGTL